MAILHSEKDNPFTAATFFVVVQVCVFLDGFFVYRRSLYCSEFIRNKFCS